MSAKDSFQCACGDHPFQVVPERQGDSWWDQGFWCSSTMTLMESTGSTKYVWNPYSLAELKGYLGARGPSGRTVLDEFLLCVASPEGKTCTAPTRPVFEAQQVSPPLNFLFPSPALCVLAGDPTGCPNHSIPWFVPSAAW